MIAEVSTSLRASLSRHLPGVAVWVYGSLAKPERFSEFSDVDIALESLPKNVSIDLLQSLLSRDVEREVDICMLETSRLKEDILREGKRWIP